MMTSFLPDEGTIMHSQRQFNYLWVSPPYCPREEHGHIPLPLPPHSTFQFYEELLEASWQLGTCLITLGSYSRHIQNQSIFSHQPLMTRVEYVSLTYKVHVCGWSLVGNRNTERKLLSVSSISCNRLLRDHQDCEVLPLTWVARVKWKQHL